ncbi:MAG TPA: alpha/beta fold hydrolase [Gemmatimonadaceae bacterium]
MAALRVSGILKRLAAALVPALALSAGAQQATGQVPEQRQIAVPSEPVSFTIGADTLRGRLYVTRAAMPLATLVLVPGFGGTTGDVLELGIRLAARDVNVLVFNNRGAQESQGTLTIANALDDAAAAIAWLRSPAVRTRLGADPSRIVLGGHSFGGTVAILHAARDTGVRRVLAIAGADHATYARRMREEPGYREALLGRLSGARRPDGPVTFDPGMVIEDLLANETRYAHPPLAPRFAGRAVLLVGGWEDQTCVVEREVIPFFRALRAVSGVDASIATYTDGHGFARSRAQLAEEVHAWLERTTPR